MSYTQEERGQFVVKEITPLRGAGAMRSPEGVVEFWNTNIRIADFFDPEKEHVIVALVDTQLNVKGWGVVSIGTINESSAHPREIFKLAIVKSSYGIVLMHNHPSGNADCSSADRAITKRVKEAGQIIGIELLDHVIIAGAAYFSFRESGLI